MNFELNHVVIPHPVLETCMDIGIFLRQANDWEGVCQFIVDAEWGWCNGIINEQYGFNAKCWQPEMTLGIIMRKPRVGDHPMA